VSENESQSASKYVGALFIIIALFSILLGGIGFVWARSHSEQGTLSSAADTGSLSVSLEQSSELIPSTEPMAPRATVSAPVAPTAIATNEPEPVSFSLPTFANPVDDRFVEEADVWGANFVLIDDMNSGVWQYEANNFIRPIGLEITYDTAYLLDGGRVLALNLDQLEPPVVLLAPGDDIGGVRVLEPLDLALMDDTLFVLDRAGDVYRYDLSNGNWDLDRYDRPVEASSGHYFIALDIPSNPGKEEISNPSRILLETNYKFTMQYGGDEESLWNLPEGRSVDVSGFGNDTYVLQREMFDSAGIVTKYQDTRSNKGFAPKIEIEYPRQIVATVTAVYVLDRDGHRLLALDPSDGRLRRLYQLPQDNPVSVFAVDPAGQIYLAGQDRLYMVDQPDRIAAIPGGPVLNGMQPHDPSFLDRLDNFSVPIGGSNITFRDFQMPGAPRHYRLGVHQGLDFYWQPGTKILAAADGVVIRADLDYVPPTAAQLAAWWNESQESGFTTSDTLDNYLGQQVWIQHGEGLVTRYAHLRTIAPGIAQGTQVSRGQVVGEVGNSGSPASLESDRADAHLHFELWLKDTFLGQFMRPIETREWVERILTNGE
jgi:murein DD-endopeptidase MepM/ murein hydrolase activator NlpD